MRLNSKGVEDPPDGVPGPFLSLHFDEMNTFGHAATRSPLFHFFETARGRVAACLFYVSGRKFYRNSSSALDNLFKSSIIGDEEFREACAFPPDVRNIISIMLRYFFALLPFLRLFLRRGRGFFAPCGFVPVLTENPGFSASSESPSSVSASSGSAAGSVSGSSS